MRNIDEIMIEAIRDECIVQGSEVLAPMIWAKVKNVMAYILTLPDTTDRAYFHTLDIGDEFVHKCHVYRKVSHNDEGGGVASCLVKNHEVFEGDDAVYPVKKYGATASQHR
jgi:hypothetical protein